MILTLKEMAEITEAVRNIIGERPGDTMTVSMDTDRNSLEKLNEDIYYRTNPNGKNFNGDTDEVVVEFSEGIRFVFTEKKEADGR